MSEIIGAAHFSEDGKHRFYLTRVWDAFKDTVLFIGLNPSTANERNDDPTIKSCIRLTKNLGYGGFTMCNLFTYITASPKVLMQNSDDANRPMSFITMSDSIAATQKQICAWGNFKIADGRAKVVFNMIKNPYCFGINKSGTPKHPLYLKSNSQLIPFEK